MGWLTYPWITCCSGGALPPQPRRAGQQKGPWALAACSQQPASWRPRQVTASHQLEENNGMFLGRLVVRSKNNHVCGGPGTVPTCHRYLRSDTRGHLGRQDFSEVSPALLEPKGCFLDQMGSMSWLEQDCVGTWMFCPGITPDGPETEA